MVLRLVRKGEEVTLPAETHAACQALIGHLRTTLAEIAALTAPYQGQSPQQDVYERAQEALQVESGREVQEELQLLRDIAHHAKELHRPWLAMNQAQRQEHYDCLMEALAAYAAFRLPRLWWEGRP